MENVTKDVFFVTEQGLRVIYVSRKLVIRLDKIKSILNPNAYIN